MNRIKTVFQKLWSYETFHIFMYSIALNAVIECLNNRGLTGLLKIFTSPVIFLMNTLIIMTTLSIGLFFKRRIFVYVLMAVLWIILAFINFVVLYSRKTPFTAMDIYLISDAIKVIPLYINVFQMILIVVGIIAVISGLVMLFKRTKVYTQELPLYKQLLHSGFKFAVIFLLTYAVAASLIINGYVQTHFGNLAQAYKQYGFVYCFTSSIKDRGISKSKEYSEEYIDGIKDELDENVPDASETSPNIIFVQLESFFDPKLVKGVTFSSNPTPNLDRIMKEYSSGYLSVPCFGAGTANTEFEVQTGVNLDDFGPGEYPYRTVMQSKYFLENKAVWLNEDGVLEIDMDKMVPTAQKMLAEIIRVQLSKDFATGEKYVLDNFVWTDEMEIISKKLKEIDKSLNGTLKTPLADKLAQEI